MKGQVLIAHVAQLQPVTYVRSTILQSSLASLRTRGSFDEWCRLVDPDYRDIIVESLAPTWLPISVGVAHYTACEALMLPQSEQVAMGEVVGDRIQGTFMGTLMRSARAAGMNPMILLSQFDRMWARVFQGGSIQLVQTGPKDLDIEVRGLPLVRLPYFRTAFCGVVRAGIAFSGVRSAHVKPRIHRPEDGQYVMHAAWV
jgi:Protein of unknown function (DUF2378)